MRVKRLVFRLAVFLTLASVQLFAIYSEEGQFFAKPADHKEAQSLIRTKTFAKRSSRPIRTEHYTSPSGHFIIHYDNSGYNEVPQEFNFNDSIPDFVYQAAHYLDESFSTLHDSLGFNAPPIDETTSPEIDVYFRYDNSYYGVTTLETSDTTGAWTSYLTLSTLLGDSTIFYTYGLEGLSVTCAHELFHIFQLGYTYRSQDVFYFEMSSVWFEEYMYPEVNDYHSYINNYAQQWNYAINSGSLDYNNVGFNLYIDKRFSTKHNSIIKNIWDRILRVNGLTAIRDELEARGITFQEALRDWGSAQVLCGPYAADNFAFPFHDSAELETVSFDNYSNKIIRDLEEDISLTSNPGVFYFKLTNLPNNFFLFDMSLSEGTDINLVCLDGQNSQVKHFNGNPLVIDGSQFSDCILIIGLDAENATGSLTITELYENQFAGIWPNPLYHENSLSISYVLLKNNQKCDIAIYNLSGKKVYSHSLSSIYRNAGLQELSIRPQNLASGLYIITLHTDDGIIAGKFTFIK